MAQGTPHCLRHISITQALHADDTNVVDIVRASGHSLKMLEEHAHSADDRAQQAVPGLKDVVRTKNYLNKTGA